MGIIDPHDPCFLLSLYVAHIHIHMTHIMLGAVTTSKYNQMITTTPIEQCFFNTTPDSIFSTQPSNIKPQENRKASYC